MVDGRPTDEQIRKMAKARVEFKQHLAAYLIINAMLVAIWGITSDWHFGGHWSGFWPIWTLLFWGIGLAFHGLNTYSAGAGGMVDREEAKLREKFQK